MTIPGENLDAMGVVTQSNFDDDLHSGGVENVGDDLGDSNVLDSSVARMTNDSFGSITLQEYSKTEFSQEYSKDELDSDLDITCSDNGSNYDPSEQDEKLYDREMRENENISITTKPSTKRKKKIK